MSKSNKDRLVHGLEIAIEVVSLLLLVVPIITRKKKGKSK